MFFILKLIFFYLYIVVIAYGNNKFIIDYFQSKQISMLLGFPCHIDYESLSMIKDFSKIGISVSIQRLEKKSKVHVLAKTNYRKIGVFLDLRCSSRTNVASLFSDASDYRMFGELHCWLLLVSDMKNILDVVDDQAFGLSTDFLIAEFSNYTNHFVLYDVYNFLKERGNDLKVTLQGSWNENVGLTVIEDTKFNRRSNMNGFLFKTMFFKTLYRASNESLEDYLDDFTRATLDGQSKYGYHVVKHLSELYNFSLKYSESSEWLHGDSKGPIEQALVNYSIDINGSPFTMNIGRTYVLKFVHQDWPFRTCFIFRNPQPKNIKIQELLRPFTNRVWYFAGLFFIFFIIMLNAVLRNENCNIGLAKYSNSVLITIGAICQQGTDIEMKKISTRIVFLSVLLFNLLIYNYYSASIVSARLDEPIIKINDSLNQFGKLNMKMASEAMVYLEFFLKKPDWDTVQFFQNYWSNLPVANWYMTPEKGMQLVKKGGFAYHTHPNIGYKIIDKTYDNREICELMEVHLARPTHTAFAVTMNSSIVELVRVGLTKISEVGIKQRHVLRWSFPKPRCRKDILTASSISIEEFAPHLLFLMIGMLMAIFFYSIEMTMAYLDTFNELKIQKLTDRNFLNKYS